MSFVQETAWSSATITGNQPSTTVVPTFSGGGAELIIIPLVVDNGNGCTGAHFNAHANLTLGTSYIGTATNNTIMVFVWGTWNGPAQSPSLIVTYDGGNSGTNGGKIQNAVFTGYASNIIAAPGPSGFATGTSATASVTVNSVAAGSLLVCLEDNSGNVNFTAGAGYTLAFNTSVWFTNHRTGLQYTTGLSEPGGTATPTATLTSSTWTMMGVAFPSSSPPTLAIPPANQCIVFP